MMKFGIREVCDLTFTKISGVGPTTFTIDTAKMNTLESASTTVYAQGGKGNSRLMAWEGEKTLTFTVEDALLTMDSFWALTGADVSDINGGVNFKIKPVSFAAYYRIVADTLFRDEDGVDHKATLTIPKAKLQTNLSLSMAPTGDPSTFTFTFDAFPDELTPADSEKILFNLFIEDIDEDFTTEEKTSIILNGVVYSTDSNSPAVCRADDNYLYLGSSSDGSDLIEIGMLQQNEIITNLEKVLSYAEDGTDEYITLTKGTTTTFYII